MSSQHVAEDFYGSSGKTRYMNADMAWRLTTCDGWNMPSPKPVDIPVTFIHLISLQNGWLAGTSGKGAVVHAESDTGGTRVRETEGILVLSPFA